MKATPLLIALFFISLSACKDKDAPEFDRTALLENVGSNVIIPNMTQFKSELSLLGDLTSSFTATPTIDNMLAMRSQYMTTYRQFQHIKMYDFGPGEDSRFKITLNTYPTNTAQITTNIESGTYNLETAENATSIGFPALDYILYNGTDAEVLEQFTTAPTADNAKTYILDLVTKMNTEFTPVESAWTSSYKTTFVAANGTDVGSSVSLFFNGMVKDIELVKNAKIGIPSGQLSGGETFPTYVEGLYSGQSKVLAIENMNGLLNLFLGGSGVGLDDYMNFIEEHEGINVSAAQIKVQFDDCIAEINSLGNAFSTDIPTNAAGFTNSFQELKKLVAYAKTDISAALGVLISFSDTDGD